MHREFHSNQTAGGSMYSGSTLIPAFLAVIVMCVAVSASSKRPVADWNYYHFDGRGFVAGQPAEGNPFLALSDRTVPVVLTRMIKIEAMALPAGKGALAGICYLQSPGGKLAGGSGYSPYPGLPVAIFSGDSFVSSVVSDENGYFVALLPAGSYRIGSGAFKAEATLVNGTTTLVPLRAGKRMVD
jgi:hypothetical protein